MAAPKYVEVDADALNALMDAFDALNNGQIARLRAWLEEYEMTEEELDAHMKTLGHAVGRDFGIL